MARSEHHSAHAFLLYFFIHLFWLGPQISGWIVFLVLFFGFFPDIDGIYWRIKEKKKMDTQFQHHLYYWTHWPLSYTPVIITFIISLLLNIFPLYFLIPVIGIYYGHFFFDSISTGDGIMWGKIPWKKGHYAQYVNLFSSKTDGYHGNYWNVRYRRTIFFKLGHIAAIISTVIILALIFTAENFDIFYVISIIYLISFSLAGLKKYPEQYYREPPEGRYADYRRNPKYIEGLSEKNRKKLLEKYP